MQFPGQSRPQITLTPQRLQNLCRVATPQTVRFNACELGAQTLRPLLINILGGLTGQSVPVLGGGTLFIGQLRQVELRCPFLPSLATFEVVVTFLSTECRGFATVSFRTNVVAQMLTAGAVSAVCSGQICLTPAVVERFELACAPPGALESLRRFFGATAVLGCVDATGFLRDLHSRGVLTPT